MAGVEVVEGIVALLRALPANLTFDEWIRQGQPDEPWASTRAALRGAAEHAAVALRDVNGEAGPGGVAWARETYADVLAPGAL